jgi:hypothetical protein
MFSTEAGYSPTVRVPFALRYRVGLAITIALVTYVAWAALIAAPSAAFALAAALGNQASRAVLQLWVTRLADGWTWALIPFAALLVVVTISTARLVIATATAWFLSIAVLVVLSSVAYGFSLVSVPVVVCAALVAVSSGFGARAAD